MEAAGRNLEFWVRQKAQGILAGNVLLRIGLVTIRLFVAAGFVMPQASLCGLTGLAISAAQESHKPQIQYRCPAL